jgi:V8-like Glu-specific endopeptidase
MRTLRRLSSPFLVLAVLALVLAGFPRSAFSQDTAGETIYLPLVTTSSTTAATDEFVIGPNSEVAPVPEQEMPPELMDRETLMSIPAYEPPPSGINVEELPANLANAPAMTVDGEPGEGEGTMPVEGIDEMAQEMYAEQWAGIEATSPPEASDESIGLAKRVIWPFRAYYVEQYFHFMSYPFRTMGRLYFYIPGRGWAWCSASTAGGRAIWTAAHCVYSPGRGWHSRIYFAPAYRNGYTPYGWFSWRRAVVYTSWQRYAWASSDFAVVTFYDKRASNGRYYTLAQWTGAMSTYWNHPRAVGWRFYSHGYPSGNHPNRGRFLYACDATVRYADRVGNYWRIWQGCNTRPGSSGGPWVIAGGGRYYINGVVSQASTVYEIITSPYFDSRAGSLYRWGIQQ